MKNIFFFLNATNVVVFKTGHSGLFMIYFWSFSNKQLNLHNKFKVKNIHPVHSAGIRTMDLKNMSLIP